MKISCIKKEFNNRIKKAKNEEKRSTCFILRNIEENGHVDMCGTFGDVFIDELLDNRKGINNASTFHMICGDCENKYFKDYESFDKIKYLINNLENFEDETVRKQLAEIYSKSLIKEIYTKSIYDKHVHADFIHKLLSDNVLRGTNTDKITDLTLRDYLIDYKYCSEILKGDNEKGFIKYFSYILPYRVKIATQTLICLRRGLKNETVNFCQSTDENLKMEEICFVCFPLEKNTLILIFGLKTSKPIYKQVFKDINKLSFEEKLKALQAILFSHSEEVYVSPSLKKLMSSDDSFQKIANQELLPTPFPTIDGRCLLIQSYARIDQFRDCNNCYFSRKYSKHN